MDPVIQMRTTPPGYERVDYERLRQLSHQLSRYAKDYAFFAANGVCDQDHDHVRRLEHGQEHMPMYCVSPKDMDPMPLRSGSLSHDYHNAIFNVDSAKALMNNDMLSEGKPAWRPEYEVCLEDLKYHFAVYCQIPTLRPLALYVFKQCLISYVPLHTGLPATNDSIQKAFGDLILEIYEMTDEEDQIRFMCAQFGVWVQERCTPRQERSQDRLALYRCVLEARRVCWNFEEDVLDAMDFLEEERRLSQERAQREKRVTVRRERRGRRGGRRQRRRQRRQRDARP
ncbi:hypothetical protein PG984_014068 [Apiospora sp. TS-2023a]